MRYLAIAAALAAFLFAPPVAAQPGTPCARRAEFIKHLNMRYNEFPVAMGLTVNGSLLEVVVSPAGSWTIIVTSPAGIACGVASGMNWENTDKIPVEEPAA